MLLIEDDADIAEAIGYQLEKAGLQVRVARTGEEGLEAVRKGVDLVLLDLNLPGMDGLEVCRMIRRQQTTAHVPIIIVSARADEVDRVLGLEMGADDYVVKPFSLKELAARAKVALRRNADERRAAAGLPRRELGGRVRRLRGALPGPGDPAHATRSSSCSATWSSGRAACSRASGCSSASGAARSDVDDAQHRRAHPAAAARSSARRATTSRRSSGLGYRFVK